MYLIYIYVEKWQHLFLKKTGLVQPFIFYHIKPPAYARKSSAFDALHLFVSVQVCLSTNARKANVLPYQHYVYAL